MTAAMNVEFYMDDARLKAAIEKAYSVSHRQEATLRLRTLTNVVFDPVCGLFKGGANCCRVV